MFLEFNWANLFLVLNSFLFKRYTHLSSSVFSSICYSSLLIFFFFFYFPVNSSDLNVVNLRGIDHFQRHSLLLHSQPAWILKALQIPTHQATPVANVFLFQKTDFFYLHSFCHSLAASALENRSSDANVHQPRGD